MCQLTERIFQHCILDANAQSGACFTFMLNYALNLIATSFEHKQFKLTNIFCVVGNYCVFSIYKKVFCK